MTFRNNIGPDAVAAATLAPSAFEPGLAPFKLLAAAAAVGKNNILKQRVRQLSTDNRTLDERLKAARSNQRLNDGRIANLETRLTESANPT